MRPARLDRIVRGRAWIPVLGVLLVAIVGLRVEVLKLGSGVGAQVQQATLLQSENAVLSSQISALSDSKRITKLAAAYGMHMPNPLDVHIINATAGTHLAAAAKNISAPSTTSFLGGLVSEQQANQQSTDAVAASTDASTSDATTTDTATADNTADTALSSAASTDTGATSDATTASTDTGSSTASLSDQTTSDPGPADTGTSAVTDTASSDSADAGGGSLSTGTADSSGGADSQATTGADTASTNGGTGLAG